MDKMENSFDTRKVTTDDVFENDRLARPAEKRTERRKRSYYSQSSYNSDGSFRSRTSSYYSETGGSQFFV